VARGGCCCSLIIRSSKPTARRETGGNESNIRLDRRTPIAATNKPPVTRKITQSIPEQISLASPRTCGTHLFHARSSHEGPPNKSLPEHPLPLLSSKCPASSTSHTTARSPLLCSSSTTARNGNRVCSALLRMAEAVPTLSLRTSRSFSSSPPRAKQPLVALRTPLLPVDWWCGASVPGHGNVNKPASDMRVIYIPRRRFQIRRRVAAQELAPSHGRLGWDKSLVVRLVAARRCGPNGSAGCHCQVQARERAGDGTRAAHPEARR
jgi:hypothetical protein